MLVYFYTFKGHLTHSDPQYFQRGKLGETDRKGILNESSSERSIYKRVLERIKQQDNAAVSEAPIILGYWFVKTDAESEVDAAIRNILLTRHGAKITRTDKRKNEWIIIPRHKESDRVALVETAIREYSDGQVILRVMEERTLRDFQVDIAQAQWTAQKKAVASGAATCKTLHIAGCAAGKTTNEINLMEIEPPGDKQVNILCTSGIELANQICNDCMNITTTSQAYGSRKLILVHSGRSGIPGVEATVDPNEIARQINNANVPVWMIVVYNSVRTAAEGIAIADNTVHVKVLDEVHRTTGQAVTVFTDAVLLRCDTQAGFTASFRAITR